MSTYTPVLAAENVQFEPSQALSLELKRRGITHVEDARGRVWRIAGSLNKKSVPLVPVEGAPSRINFTSVASFGVEDDEPETEPAPAATAESEGEQSKEEAEEGGDSDGVAATAETENPPQTPTPQPQPEHALLSASGAHRWLNCPPSAHLETQYPDEESDAAAEGTAAHELAEHKLRLHLGHPTTRPESEWEDEDMDDYTDQYVDNVTADLAAAQQHNPAAFLTIEQRLDFSHIVPGGFGTGDAIIVADDTLTIIDLKYGKGVKVDAEHNPQMSLYALGALKVYGMIYPIKTVRMIIFQPRLSNTSVWETTVEYLQQWAETVVKPQAAQAAHGVGVLNAGQWCQFCRHHASCPAVAKQFFDVVPMVDAATPAAPEPDTLTEEQLVTIVTMAAELKQWLTKVEDYALQQALGGRSFDGLKVVEGRSVRRFTDEDKVAELVKARGHDPYVTKLLGITAMQKLLGRKQFDLLLGGLLVKPAGKPTLVAVSDPRPALVVATPENTFNVLEGP